MFKGFILIIAISLNAFCDDGFMEFGEKGYFEQNKKKSKWIFEMGANYLQYPSALPEFDGVHEEYKKDKNLLIWGTDINWGYEQHLAGGFSTTIRIGGFYNKTIGEVTGKAADDIDLDAASIDSEYELYGAQASLSLNYLVDNSFLPFQTYAEFGVGKGFSIIDEKYEFEGALTDPEDLYDVKIKDDYTSARLSIGINFISSRGLFSYFKATQTSYLFTNRKINAEITQDGIPTSNSGKSTLKDETASSLTYAIGMGALF